MAKSSGRRIIVVAAVVSDGDLVLACRRRVDKPAGGKWEFPGGKVELGESRENALIREIREELGVEIEVRELLRTDTTPVGSLVIQLSCYSAALVSERPKSSTDHDLLEWIERAQLSGFDWAAPDLPMVRELLASK